MNMKNPPHPGEILKEVLLAGCELNVTQAAELLGVSRASLSKIINQRGGISPEMAVRLSLALNTSSEMWLNLQTQYDLSQAELKRNMLAKLVTKTTCSSRYF